MKNALKIRIRYGDSEKAFELPDDHTVIGRADSLLVKVSNCSAMSREHLKVEIRDSQIWIEDLGSSNGTFLNGKQIPRKTPVRYEGEALMLGSLSEGAEVWIEIPSVPSKSNQIIELSERLDFLRMELEGVETLKAEVEARQNTMLKRVEDLIFREVELFKSIDELKKRADEGMMECEFIQHTLQDWKDKKQKAEIALSEHEATMEGIQRANREEEERLIQKQGELEAFKIALESERELAQAQLDSEKGRLQAVQVQAQERLEIEMDRMQAELKLKRAQLENEVEELRSKKLLMEREIESIGVETRFAEERIPKLKNELKNLDSSLEMHQRELGEIREEIPKRRYELKEIEASKAQAHRTLEAASLEAARLEARAKEEIEASKTQAHRTLEAASLEAARLEARAKEEILAKQIEWETREKQIKEESEQRVATQMALLQSEREEARAALQTEMEEMRQCVNLEQSKARELWDQKQAEMRNKFQADQQALEKARDDEIRVTRERALKEVRVQVAAEEQKMRQVITDQRWVFARKVTGGAFTRLAAIGELVSKKVLTELEGQLVHAIEDYSNQEGYSVESHSESKKKFLKKSGITAGVAVAAVLALVFGPGLFKAKIEVLKAENAAQNAQMMKEVREQRERMLALHLEVRKEFQESYVDNILYNPGYLAMKQDESIQKNWTTTLSKVFFDELLLDDRKVVNYLPAETAMIRALSDVNQVLNAANFEVNLSKMRLIEKERETDLWIAAGGKENWIKLRKKEAEFYLEQAASFQEPKSAEMRKPATSL